MSKERLKIVVITGAGMSKESGLATFRDSDDGMWNEYKIEEVCSTEAIANNFPKVLEFYNARRAEMLKFNPNRGHYYLGELENDYDVHIVTQNVDNYHEKAGSVNVLHLHGELSKCRSMTTGKVQTIIEDLKVGDLCEDGGQLRPHIVVFGEAVPNLAEGAEIVSEADIILVVGTSLQVYPAASLLQYFGGDKELMFLIDPNDMPEEAKKLGFTHIKDTAVKGMPTFVKMLEAKLNKKTKK